MVTIAEKINLLLEQRGLLKRDLARALGISPQTATDICKGRSAITLPHLRKLIAFFGIRADFWMDEERLEPGRADELIPHLEQKIQGLADLGLLHAEEPARFVERLLEVAHQHRDTWIRRFGEPRGEERKMLGIPGEGHGSMGRIAAEQAPIQADGEP